MRHARSKGRGMSIKTLSAVAAAGQIWRCGYAGMMLPQFALALHFCLGEMP